MALDQKLEFFLDDLNAALRPLPTSERLEILTRVKAAFEEKLRSGLSPEAVLQEIGSPAKYASPFRKNFGYGGAAPSVLRAGVKWLLILLFLFFLLIPLTLGLLVWKLFPLISVRDDGRSVKILGGMIDLDNMSGDFQSDSGDWGTQWGEAHSVEGELPISQGHPHKLLVKFRNGKIHLATSEPTAKAEADSSDSKSALALPTQKLSWKCRFGKKATTLPTAKTDDEVELDVTSQPGANCDILVPRGFQVEVEGTNGNVELHEPAFSARVELANGNVSIAPSVDEKYHYNLRVDQGRVDEFENDKADSFWNLEVRISNGSIQRR